MTKKVVPLKESEKELFKKTHRNRLWIALFFGIPLIGGIGFMTYQFIDYQVDVFTGEINNTAWDLGSYIFFFFLVFCHTGFWFYFIPLYRKSFQNIRQTNKIIATTTILNVQGRLHTKGGFTYNIETDYMNMNTYFNVFLVPISFEKLQKGMTIEIHHLEHNFIDIIKIVILK